MMRTFAKEFEITGIGIHSGAPVLMRVRPAASAEITFKRSDLLDDAIIATYDNVGATFMRNTTIGDMRGAHIQTIEHIMATLYIMGIDGAHFEIDGPETPILDGSAAEFYKLFSDAGTVEIDAPVKKIIIKREVTVEKDDSFVRLYPDNRGLFVSARLVYTDKIIGDQSYEFLFDGTPENTERFLKDIARSRTFGKVEEWDGLKKMGMAHGASEFNVIAIGAGGDNIANPEPYGLYYPDEFVRHKIIDIIGDMFTAGGRIIGGVDSYKGSHALNNEVLKKLFADSSNYDIIQG